jgi:hypothetical protein
MTFRISLIKEVMMIKNMGIVDRTLRVILGIVLILLVFVGPQTPWGWVGLIPLLTGLVSWCPAYVPFKFSTIKKEKK